MGSEMCIRDSRYYLSDAVFLAGLEGDEQLLISIEQALKNPVFPLALGRRSCPPEGQVALGIRFGKALLPALRDEPWLVSDWTKGGEAPEVRLRIVSDAGLDAGPAYLQRDMPLAFDQLHRKHGFRLVAEGAAVTLPNPSSRRAARLPHTSHDAMTGL